MYVYMYWCMDAMIYNTFQFGFLCVNFEKISFLSLSLFFFFIFPTFSNKEDTYKHTHNIHTYTTLKTIVHFIVH